MHFDVLCEDDLRPLRRPKVSFNFHSCREEVKVVNTDYVFVLLTRALSLFSVNCDQLGRVRLAPSSPFGSLHFHFSGRFGHDGEIREGKAI